MIRKLLFVCVLLSSLAAAQSSTVTGPLTASGSSCALNAALGPVCLILPIGPSTNTVAATLGGTFTGTLQFEGSGDNGSTWVSVAATPSSGGSSVTSATGTGTWQIQSGGYTYLRIRCSTYSSGTVTATLNPSKAVTAQAGSGGGSPGGSTDALQYNAGSSTFGGLNSPTTNCNYLVGFNVTGGAAVAPTAECPGIVPRASVCNTSTNADTILSTDRLGYVTENDASACAVTLPTPGSTGFTNNFAYFTCDIGPGTATITPSSATISYTTGSAYTSGALTLALTTGQCASIKSDNTNYFANVFAAGSSAAGPTFTGTYWVPLYVFPGSATASATSLFNANEPQVFGFNCCVPGGGAAESTTLWIYVSTGQSAATCDAGLYGPITSSSTTASLALHTGSFACATSSLYLSQAVAGGPVTTPPGFYLEAVCSSNSGVTFGAAGVQAGWVGSGNALAKVAGHDAAGGSEACTSGVLPSSITLVNITADGKYAPIMTMTN